MSTEASDPCEVVGCFLSKWSNKNAIARSAPRERIYRTFSLLLARARSSSCFFHFLPPSFCRNKRGKKKICHREIETKAALVLRYEQRRIPLFCFVPRSQVQLSWWAVPSFASPMSVYCFNLTQSLARARAATLPYFVLRRRNSRRKLNCAPQGDADVSPLSNF